MSRMLQFHKNKPRTKAQGMVEFALALPVLLLLVLGIIEFARLMLTYSAVYSASREAVRYAIAIGASANGVPHYQDCGEIKANGVRVGSFGGVRPEDIDIRYDHGLDELTPEFEAIPLNMRCNPDAAGVDTSIALQTGDRVRVRVRTSFDPIVPIVNLPPLVVDSEIARTFYTAIDVRGTPLPTNSPIPPPVDTDTPEPSKTDKKETPPTATLTPSNTPTLNGTLPTSTTTPTPPPTKTPFVPSSTPTRTATLTPSPTSSEPTPTPSPSNTPAIDCPKIIQFGNPIVGGNLFSILVSNHSSIGTPEATYVRSISVQWPDADKYLINGWFGIYPFVTTGSNGTPFYTQDLTGVYFTGDTIFQLGYDSLLDEASDLPTIDIAFEDNCVIHFEGSPLPETSGLPLP